MGWLYTYKTPGESVTEFLQRESLGDDFEVLESSLYHMQEWYAAVRVKKTGEVFAAAYLVDCRNGRDGCNFGWKSVDESMGPYYYHCPARILDLLSPTDSPHALEWRRKCRERIATKQSVKNGDRLRFSRPIHFTDDTEADTFVIQFVKRRAVFFQVRDGEPWTTMAYRISGWRDRDYEVLDSPTQETQAPEQVSLF